MTKRYCVIDGCDNQLGKRAKSEVCTCCQAGLRYWDDRDYTDILKRQDKLSMWGSRMKRIAGQRVSINSSRKTRTARIARTAEAGARH